MQPIRNFFFYLSLFTQHFSATMFGNVAHEGSRTYGREPEIEAGGYAFQNLAHLFLVHELPDRDTL